MLGCYLRVVEPTEAEAREWGNDPSKPIEQFFDMQARRIYPGYQTPYALAEDVALILREWIDTCFDLKLERTPVVMPTNPTGGGSETRESNSGVA